MPLRPHAGILVLALALAPASGSAEDLDHVPHRDGAPLDAVDAGADDEPLDAAADATSDALPASAGSRALDDVPAPEPRSLEQAEETPGWRPTPCDELALDLPPAPAASRIDAWKAVLRDARASFTRSQQALQSADAAYSRALTSQEPRGAERAEIVEARERARREFSRARCALPTWLERAQRAGVPPDVLRSFAGS